MYRVADIHPEILNAARHNRRFDLALHGGRGRRRWRRSFGGGLGFARAAGKDQNGRHHYEPQIRGHVHHETATPRRRISLVPGLRDETDARTFREA
jgi:hypothetical protein